MRLYFDTCIVNDTFVLIQIHGGNKLHPQDVKCPLDQWILEYIALYYLLDLDDQWELEFGSSHVMREELKNMRIRAALAREKKGTMLQMYDLLEEKIISYELLTCPESLLKEISKILPGRKDIEHVCQAVLGRWDYFITTDRGSILKHAEQLKPLGIVATSPRAFVEDNFLTLEELVRTLHGSWTNLEDVVNSWVNEIQACVVS
jgi:hypothetical protein